MSDRKVIVVLENIRSAHNVGAIFRTADGAGVDEIYLVGYTPRPIDRFGREQAEIQKTSLGASGFISWEYFETVTEALKKLQTDGCMIVAVEQAGNSIPYTDLQKEERVAFVFGNEVDGVSREVTESAHVCVEIPMCGQKESLNVSTTAGIMLFSYRDR